jgi:hypothetical protein
MDDALGLDPDDAEQAVKDRTADLRGCITDAAGLAKIPPPTPLIEGWLNLDSLAWVVGEPGSAKSFTVLGMAGAMTNGAAWNGCPTKQVPVLYVVLEGAAGLSGRISVWEDYHQMSHGAYFLVPRGRVHLVTDAEPLARLAKDLDAGLVIIDTQNRATVGLDENSNLDMGHMIAGMELIKAATGACVANVHHTGIGQTRPRGHSSIDGAADTIIRVAKDGGLVKIANSKQKDSGRSPVVLLNATPHQGGLVLTAATAADMAVTDSERKLMAALRDIVASQGSATHSELKRACVSGGMADGTFNWALRRCRERGMIAKGDKGRWIPADPTQGKLGGPGW